MIPVDDDPGGRLALEPSQRREAIMLEIARALNASLTVETAVEHVLELIGQAIGADAVSVFIKGDEPGNGDEMQVSFARTGGGLQRGAVSISLGLSGFVLESGSAILVDDVEQEPRFKGKLDTEFGTRTRSLIAVPMRRRERLNGLIEALRETPEPFDESDLTFMIGVGHELAVAVENARLIGRLQDEVRDRELLLGAARAVGQTLDLDAVMTALLTTLSELVPYDAVGVYLLSQESGELIDVQHRGYPPGVATVLSARPGKGITGWAARNRSSVKVGDVREDPRYIEARPSTRSEVAVPVIRADDVIGVITVESDELDAYTDRQVSLLEIFASQVASAITNARLYQQELDGLRVGHELELARQIQAAALPAERLGGNGAEAMGVNVASDVVGGDYFDYFWAGEDCMAVALGDVSGHGISASLLMTAVRTAVRMNAAPEISPAALFERLGGLLYESTPANQFVAAVLGLLDTRSGELRYANAGHAPPLRVGTDGDELFQSTGLILGAFPESDYEDRRLQLEPGDVLVFYTDGVTEMRSPEGEEYGLDRLASKIREYRTEPLDRIIDEVRSAVRGFRGGGAREDDTTLMLARWLGPPARGSASG